MSGTWTVRGEHWAAVHGGSDGVTFDFDGQAAGNLTSRQAFALGLAAIAAYRLGDPTLPEIDVPRGWGGTNWRDSDDVAAP